MKNILKFFSNKKIKFNYEYKTSDFFPINLKFKFKKYLTLTAWMFFGCYSLESIDLNMFKGDNISNMCYMLDGCDSLKSIAIFLVSIQVKSLI